MKLLSYKADSRSSYGALTDVGVVDLASKLSPEIPDLKALLRGDGIERARAIVKAHEEGAGPFLALDTLELLPVIPNPGKIFCIGLNYAEHVREVGREISEKPVVFMRFADSQVGHGQAMIRPPESTEFDYEGEIAVVIGKPGRRITEADAWNHIAGYSCYNDGSIRDWQRHTSQWGPGKNFWRTGGFGPWLVTADEIPADAEMTLVTRLNGVEMQRATTPMMIHSIPRQIAYLSRFLPLEPGDVIVTGTPGGVGAKRNPPVFMKAGDTVEIEVDRIGILRNSVRDE